MGHTLRLLGLFGVLKKWFGLLDAMLAKHRYLAAHYRGESEPDRLDRFLREFEAKLATLAALLRDPTAVFSCLYCSLNG